MNYILSVLLLALSVSNMHTQEVINVYGPGGPHVALIEAAELFKEQTGVTVNINFGPQATWQDKALKNADILYSASDNQMVAFLQTHNKNFKQENVTPLYLHKSIILVQKGNPKKIKGIRSLISSGARIVVNDGAGVSQTSGTGVWEDIVGRLNNIEDIAKFRKQIVAFVPNSGMGRAKFTDPTDPADVWITWEDWALSNDLGDAVAIEKDLAISRPLTMAVKNNAKQSIHDFVAFLSTPEAQKIFKKYGWNKK